MDEKGVVRKEVLARLNSQGPGERKEKSTIIKNKVFSLPEFRKAKNIVCYISLDTEVSTGEIIKDSLKMSKRVFAPRVEGDSLRIVELKNMDEDLERGPIGVLQPKNEASSSFRARDMEIVIVPGIAFERNGARLGRGKGYFDRFLSKLPNTVKTIALGFDFQIKKSIPVSPHDIPVDLVITN